MRTDRIGDAILFSGALAPLRAHWPEARIDLMVPPEVLPLFRNCPHIDGLLSARRLFPWDTWQRCLPRGGWAFERLLLQRRLLRLWYPHYDIAIYPVSAPIEVGLRAMRLLDATEKWGFGGDQLRWMQLEDEANSPERVFTRCYRNSPEDRWKHEIPRTKAFLDAMGVHADAVDPELWLAPGDFRDAARVLPEGDALGIFLGAGSPLRQWPLSSWAEMLRRQGVSQQIVLFGGKADRKSGRQLETQLAGSGLRIVNLIGRTRLGELAACIQRCVALVSNDSSGLHLAVAQGIPAVGILGGYHYGRFYPWGDPRIHRVANVPMDCYHCNDDCRYGDWRCVRDVPMETVLRELGIAGEVRGRRSEVGGQRSEVGGRRSEVRG